MLKSRWMNNDNVALWSYMEITDCREENGYSIWKDWATRNGACSDKFEEDWGKIWSDDDLRLFSVKMQLICSVSWVV